MIYDSECSDHLMYDKDRFINEIRSACEWIKTSEDFMLIEKYDTMLMNAKLNDQNRRLLFENTAYISFIDVTLVFSTKLIKQRFDRCSRTNTLMKMSTRRRKFATFRWDIICWSWKTKRIVKWSQISFNREQQQKRHSECDISD
jgi:hypothetical protein